MLFFDGGSRGNPGPGGSGAAIVRIGEDAISHSLVWTGGASFARKTTTNNVAEFQRLIWGSRLPSVTDFGRFTWSAIAR